MVKKPKIVLFSGKLTFLVEMAFFKTEVRKRSFEGDKKLNSLILKRVNHFLVVEVELANF